MNCPHPDVLMFSTQMPQWCKVTNTVWWQDFPRLDIPDYLSLFSPISAVGNSGHLTDFGAQLAGFMASLVADVPSQAHWILELTNYDFKGSVGYLVASVPGVHSSRIPCISKPKYFLGVSALCPFEFGCLA